LAALILSRRRAALTAACAPQCQLKVASAVLCPTLQPSQLVILDNLAAHKTPAVRQAIDATGSHLLFLPAYSPDFSPIENAFSKLKNMLPRARTHL